MSDSWVGNPGTKQKRIGSWIGSPRKKIKDPKSVIFDQVAVVKPILGELLFIESPKVVPYPALKLQKCNFWVFKNVL